MALAQDFDVMEESLRNALRHENKYQPVKTGLNQYASKTENLFPQSSEYITVFEHYQTENLQTVPNFSDDHRRQTNDFSSLYANNPTMNYSESSHEGHSSFEEFKNYCSLLTDRIRRVEEQNIELLRIAERQKHEYDKVVSQVVESEQNQRELIHECSNLRKQVQQLSYHNKVLKDQQDREACRSERLVSKSASNEDQDDRSNQTVLTQTHSHNLIVETLNLLRLKQTNDTNGNIQAPNLAPLLDLFAAIQFASRSATEPPHSPNRKRISAHYADPDLNVVREHTRCSSPGGMIDDTTSNRPDASPTESVFSQKNSPGPCVVRYSSSVLSSQSILSQDDSFHTSTPESKSLPDRVSPENFLGQSQCQIRTGPLIKAEESEQSRSSSLSVELESPDKFLPADRNHDEPKREVSPKAARGDSDPSQNSPGDELLTKGREEIREIVFSPSLPDNTRREVSSEVDDKQREVLADDPSSHDYSMTSSTNFHQQTEKGSLCDYEGNDLRDVPACSGEMQEVIHDLRPPINEDQSADLHGMNSTRLDNSSGMCKRSGQAERSSANLQRNECRQSVSADSQNSMLPSDKELKSKRKSFFSDRTLSRTEDDYDENRDEDLLDSEAFLEAGKNEFIFISSSPQTKSESSFHSNESKAVKPNSGNETKRQPQKTSKESTKRFSYRDSHPAACSGGNESTESLLWDKPGHGQESESHRNRTFSEGSIERKKPLDKLTSRLNQRLEFRRQSSVGIGDAAAHKPIFSNLAAKQKLAQNNENSATKNLRRPRFPTTNPNSRLKFRHSEEFPVENDSLTPNCPKEQGPFQDEKPRVPDIAFHAHDENHKTNQSGLAAPNPSKLKISKRAKSSPSIGADSKKLPSSGGVQTKSLVGLVKSKLSRASSKTSNIGKKSSSFEYAKHSKVSSSAKSKVLMSNEVFSSTEAGYLPPGKDGDIIRKQTKQKLLDKKVAPVDLSEIKSSCLSDVKKHDDKVEKKSEEILSDEGFAEGSTIERSEKEDSSSGVTDPNLRLPDDIESLRSKMFTSANLKPSSEKSQLNSAFSEKDISMASNEVSWRSSRDSRSRPNSFCETQNPRNFNKYSPPEHQMFDPLLGEGIGLKVDLNNDVYVTGVTIVPSSALKHGSQHAPQPSRLRSRKLQKPPSGSSALGRFMKSMSSHGGSKEDLLRNKNSSATPSKETKKNNFSEQQKNMEKAFMTSMVQAELAQGLTERCSTGSSSLDVSKEGFDEKSSYTFANTSESAGTRSSLSSIPSVSSTSSQGGESEEMSHLKRAEMPEKQVALPADRGGYSKGKSFGYSGYLNKSTSLDSNVSTSDSETNFEVSRLLSPKNNFLSSNADVSNSNKIFSQSQLNKNRPSSNPGSKPLLSSKLSSSSQTSKKQALPQTTKLAAPSKMTSRKLLAPQKSGAKAPEKSIVPPGQVSKTKLAPLSYGLGAKKTTSQANKFSMLESTSSQLSARNQTAASKLKPTSHQPLKTHNSSLKPPTGLNPTRFGNNKIAPPKTKTNIPSGLQRPRPIYP